MVLKRKVQFASVIAIIADFFLVIVLVSLLFFTDPAEKRTKYVNLN